MGIELRAVAPIPPGKTPRYRFPDLDGRVSDRLTWYPSKRRSNVSFATVGVTNHSRLAVISIQGIWVGRTGPSSTHAV